MLRTPSNRSSNLRPLLVFCAALTASTTVLAQPPEAPATNPTRLPGDTLLLHRGDDGKPHKVKSAADWGRRRAEIVRSMQSVMGTLPGAEKHCELEMKVESETDGGSFVKRQISYASEPGGRVPAYLLVPKSVLSKGAEPAPAILCLHPTDDVVGHGVVVGEGKSNYPAYGSELAGRGFVVLAPNYPQLAKYQPDLEALGWKSGTLKAVWDNMRGLDLLESLPYVKPGGFGAIGHSLGGHNAIFTSIFDDRIRVVVSSCGFDSFQDYFDGIDDVWQAGKGWTQSRYMPRLARYRGRLGEIPFDFGELLGALAPRSVLVIAPLHDSNFRARSVDRLVTIARPVYALLGRPERLQVEHPDCGHDFPEEMRSAAYALFDAALRSKEREKVSGRPSR